MSPYARRTDASHAEVKRALEVSGLAVRDLSRAGGGCPDLLVSWRGNSAVVECKSPKGKLRASQEAWRLGWEGDYVVLRTVDEALTWAAQWKRGQA